MMVLTSSSPSTSTTVCMGKPWCEMYTSASSGLQCRYISLAPAQTTRLHRLLSGDDIDCPMGRCPGRCWLLFTSRRAIQVYHSFRHVAASGRAAMCTCRSVRDRIPHGCIRWMLNKHFFYCAAPTVHLKLQEQECRGAQSMVPGRMAPGECSM